jgi:metallo-beta-lactamase family protein
METRMRLTFLGGTETVTGSKYLLESGKHRLLVDCGLFQGVKSLRRRNWESLSATLGGLDAIVLTHAHLDHSGYLPLLHRQGYRGPIHCSAATAALCGILLPDAGYLQEEEARLANRLGYSRHHPAEPLFTRADAMNCLERFKPLATGKTHRIGPFEVRLTPVGHLLGACAVRVTCDGHTVTFSGDVGRPDDPLMAPPEVLEPTDDLVVESTYGDRRHPDEDPQQALAAVVDDVARAGGVLLIPAFAVGRAQALLHLLHELRRTKAIPALPIYVDSPMATRATAVFQAYPETHRLDAAQTRALGEIATFVEGPEESMALAGKVGPMIILSASGMATGGRVLHHLKVFARETCNTLLFTGFQAPGTRGDAIVNGADAVKIHGHMVPIRAKVRQLHCLSAHADHVQMTDWLGRMSKPPTRVFVTHGETHARAAMAAHIEESLGWPVLRPAEGDRYRLPDD